MFGDRLISRFGPVNWPPRSCDLTPLDYFLWGYVKSLVYANKPQTLDHLEDNICRVIADIRPQMLEKVIENWTSRLDYIRASRGKLVENTVEVEDKSHEEEDNGESEELVEDLDKALDLEFESGVGADALFHVTYAEKNSITNINETIKKIKNVVKLFRKSPIKNILQKYVKEEFGCEKMVCLDTKTRWNSLLAMLERFLEIKSAISKALIDIKGEQMMVNVEFETVTTIVKGLKPVKIGLEKLCSRNATLLTAEGVFSFVIGD
ncbi:uncharacterized protein TNCV_3116081 [Trichonephila clavipes]|nr:uncharacterized protein TNCV_3116081 [Trichonephila clavipes]